MQYSRSYFVAVAFAIVSSLSFGQVFLDEDELLDDDDDELVESSDSDLIDGPFNMDAVLRRLGDLDEQSPAGNGDVNADGSINLSDAVYIVNWIFRNGPGPSPYPCLPFPSGGGLEPFRNISVQLELNRSDGDAEVSFSAGTDDGISRLTVHAPDGRKVVDMQAADYQDLGLEEVTIEGGDMTLDEAMEAYPEGGYLFQAVTADGVHVAGLASLTHDLLPAPEVACVAGPDEVRVEWLPVDGAAGYILEIEQDELGFSITLELEPESTILAVPAGLFRRGVDYELTLGTITEEGNLALTETDFSVPEASRSNPALERFPASTD